MGGNPTQTIQTLVKVPKKTVVLPAKSHSNYIQSFSSGGPNVTAHPEV